MKFVYVVTVPGFAKVGFTTDAEKRLASYRCTNPLVCRFDFVLQVDSRRLEKRAQSILASRFEQVACTEWFRGATCVDCLDALAAGITALANEQAARFVKERKEADLRAQADRIRLENRDRESRARYGWLIRTRRGYSARYEHPAKKDERGRPKIVYVRLKTGLLEVATSRLRELLRGKRILRDESGVRDIPPPAC